MSMRKQNLSFCLVKYAEQLFPVGLPYCPIGKSLAEFSEQVIESCHQKFAKIYRWYAVKEVESVRHGQQFHKAVLHFNSFNI